MYKQIIDIIEDGVNNHLRTQEIFDELDRQFDHLSKLKDKIHKVINAYHAVEVSYIDENSFPEKELKRYKITSLHLEIAIQSL